MVGKKKMTTYYVRRDESGKGICYNIDKLITTISTPRKIDALKIAAETAIINAGCCYYVYEDSDEIAMFYVKEEDE